MVSRASVVAMMLCGCTSVYRIPAPEPKPPAGAPTQALSMYTRGMVMIAAGDLEGARKNLQQARVYDPDSSAILLALARLEMTAGDIGKARGLYKSASSIVSNDARVWLERGRIELAFGDAETGRRALLEAERLGEPWQARARLISDDMRNGRRPRGLVQWAGRTVEDTMELRVRAELRVKAGDVTGGIADYLALIKARGADRSTVGPLIKAAQNGSGVVEALLGAERIMNDDPNSLAAPMVVGVLSSWIGDHRAAVEALERVEIAAGPLSAPMQRLLDTSRSTSAPRSTARLPPPPPLGDPVSRAVYAVEAEDWQAAEAAIREGLEATEHDARLMYIRSQVALKRDGEAAALREVEQLLGHHPDYSPALNLWAWIQTQVGGDVEQAKSRTIRAINHQPRVGAYWDTLGWALHLLGDHDTARLCLARAARLSPTDPTISDRLQECRQGESL